MKKAKRAASKAKAGNKAKSTKTKNAKKPVSQKILLVYGYGEDARPRAAAFTETDFKLARKAAGMLGLSLYVAAAGEMKSALKGIKSGNVYASGDGFAPRVNPKGFETLISDLNLTRPVPPVALPEPKLPTCWQAIGAGDLVLTESDDPNVGGYWETIVEAVDDENLVLRARDFPEVAPIKRNRFAVALLYTPGYVAPENVGEAAPGLPTDWQSIKPQHMVLANLGPRQGWYSAIVTKRAGETVTLHWQDEPKPTFTRSFPQVALLYAQTP